MGRERDAKRRTVQDLSATNNHPAFPAYLHASPSRPARPLSRTLKKGIKQLEKYCQKLPAGGVLSGDDAFKMYDTYGFPLDLTLLMCQEKGLSVDQEVSGAVGGCGRQGRGRLCSVAGWAGLGSSSRWAELCGSLGCLQIAAGESRRAGGGRGFGVRASGLIAPWNGLAPALAIELSHPALPRCSRQGYEKEMDAAKLRSQEGGNFARGGSIILEAEQVRFLAATQATISSEPGAPSKVHRRAQSRGISGRAMRWLHMALYTFTRHLDPPTATPLPLAPQSFPAYACAPLSLGADGHPRGQDGCGSHQRLAKVRLGLGCRHRRRLPGQADGRNRPGQGLP